MRIARLILLSLAICVLGASVGFAETIATKDYWVLTDGYRGEFTNSGQVAVSYGPYGSYITEGVFDVDWPGTTGTTDQFFKYDAGRLVYYGAKYVDSSGEYTYVPEAGQEFLPAVLEVGKSYTYTWLRKEYQNGLYVGAGRDTYTITVRGPFTTTVSAGSYTTYELNLTNHWETSSGSRGATPYTYYVAKGIGWVKLIRDGMSYELVSYTGPPAAPRLTLSTSGNTLSISWTSKGDVTGYTLFYAPYPAASPIGSIDMGIQTGGSFVLANGAAFYVAVQARNSYGSSGYSNIEHFVMANALSVSPTNLSLAVDQTGSCAISGGDSPYSASSSNAAVATVSVTNSTLTVTGVSTGSASVTVTDSASRSATVTVTVAAPSLSVSPSILNMTVGTSGTCAISGGVMPYSASSSNPSVATAAVNGSDLRITGASPGSATVTVTDSASNGATVSVAVIPQDLMVSPASLTVSAGGSVDCSVSGGVSPYAAASSDSSVATASVSGATLNVTGVSAGSATITVTDSGSDTATVAVNVLQTLSVTPASLSLSINQTGSCSISGGVSPYSGSSSNTSVATVSVSGSTLAVKGISTGSATVTVTDSASAAATVAVTVSGGTPSTYTNSLGQTFVLIPAGTFTMGSPSSEPGRYSDEDLQHQVTLTEAFYMQTTAVTQAQWEAVMGSNPSYFTGCPTCPVEKVSWNDVRTFITKMSQKGEGNYILPTEAQWEYAARAGTTTAFYNGGITKYSNMYVCNNDANLDAIGWHCYNSSSKTHPVGQKAANAWGLYDMPGNVYEWCQDWYGTYPSEAVTDPVGPSSGSVRVARGGSWSSYARGCRSANRIDYAPDVRDSNVGFRLLRQP